MSKYKAGAWTWVLGLDSVVFLAQARVLSIVDLTPSLYSRSGHESSAESSAQGLTRHLPPPSRFCILCGDYSAPLCSRPESSFSALFCFVLNPLESFPQGYTVMYVPVLGKSAPDTLAHFTSSPRAACLGSCV